MKKVNITYINKNKFSNALKFVCIGAALSLMLSGCVKSDVKKPIDEPQITYTEPNPTEETTKPTDNPIKENIIIENDIPEIDINNISLSTSAVSVDSSNFKISEELEEKINNYINRFGGTSSFIAINLNDGMSFGYNIDQAYQTASTIKVAVALYCFKEMEKGNGSLDELKVYEEKFRRDGSGILKNEPSGTSYTLRDLFYYTLNYSDNVAYYMVHDRFYSDKYNDFLEELGCKQLYLKNGARWGYIDARSMALIWQEIYKYKDESEYGKYLFELLTNAKYNYMEEGMEKYESAHKSGWTARETHDSGIVFANDDYIVVTLNNNNGNYSAKQQLLNISGCIENVIDEYTIYKKQKNSRSKELILK